MKKNRNFSGLLKSAVFQDMSLTPYNRWYDRFVDPSKPMLTEEEFLQLANTTNAEDIKALETYKLMDARRQELLKRVGRDRQSAILLNEYFKEHPEKLKEYLEARSLAKEGLSAKDPGKLGWFDEWITALLNPQMYIQRAVKSNPDVGKDILNNLRNIGIRTAEGLTHIGNNIRSVMEVANPFARHDEGIHRYFTDSSFRKDVRDTKNKRKALIHEFYKGLEKPYLDKELETGPNQAFVNTGAGALTALPVAVVAGGINNVTSPYVSSAIKPVKTFLDSSGSAGQYLNRLAWLGTEYSGMQPGNIVLAPFMSDLIERTVVGAPGEDYAPFEGYIPDPNRPGVMIPDPRNRTNVFSNPPIRGIINVLPGMNVPARIAGAANSLWEGQPWWSFDYGQARFPGDNRGTANQGLGVGIPMSVNSNQALDLVDTGLDSSANRGSNWTTPDMLGTQLSEVGSFIPGKYGRLATWLGRAAEFAYPIGRDSYRKYVNEEKLLASMTPEEKEEYAKRVAAAENTMRAYTTARSNNYVNYLDGDVTGLRTGKTVVPIFHNFAPKYSTAHFIPGRQGGQSLFNQHYSNYTNAYNAAAAEYAKANEDRMKSFLSR